MNRKQIIFITTLTIVAILTLAFFVGSTVNTINKKVEHYCFSELANAARHLAADMHDTADMDGTILAAMAAIIASDENYSDADLCRIMQSYNTKASYVNYVEMLRSDNTMLDSDGKVRNVSGTFDFAGEALKGPHISNASRSSLNPNERVIRNAVPVVKGGKTVFILYGVVRLSDLAKKYTTNIYDGHAYVHLIDGDTGDFMLDTWHKTAGNIRALGRRKMLPGYSLDKAYKDIKDGVAGNLGFVSRTTGTVLYLRYEPVGVNNWSVLVTVEQQYALRASNSISSRLYRMATVIGVVMLLYMSCVSFCLFSAYKQVKKLGTEDQNTGLQNRNAYEKFIEENKEETFARIICVYIDVNGLHEINNKQGHAAGDKMLRAIADALKARFPRKSVYRIGGDEFVVLLDNGDIEACRESMNDVAEQLAQSGYYISAGIVLRENETGVGRVTREADEQMLENKRQYYMTHERRRRG